VTDHFWEYADQRRRECADLSVAHDELDFYEEEGSHGMGGKFMAISRCSRSGR
jgi:hypothetical protein